MSALPQASATMTEAEYLAFERRSEIKHQYLHGEVYAMTGASRAHNLICTYALASLATQMRHRKGEIYPGQMRVKIPATGLYTYPDISVVCGEPKFADGEFDTLLNPALIIEVLSPSTESFDRGRKFQHYRQLASLQEYVLISQDSPRVERFLRQENADWVFTDAVGLESSLELPSIGCTLTLAGVYEKVTFEAGEQDTDPPQQA
ncbi:MAG: Uma2 family endonuclease [Anaerolineae bacterium]|nr:Uma2 family endonuclease [Anaerolineae bacterium]